MRDRDLGRCRQADQPEPERPERGAGRPDQRWGGDGATKGTAEEIAKVLREENFDMKVVNAREEKIKEIVTDALLHTPSPFNSQSTRVVLLFNEEHRKFWQITLDELKKKVSPEQFEQTTNKINGSFAAGYGTVLFYEEKKIVDNLCSAFPSYAERFPHWSQHTSAMHQFVIWTALEAEGLG